MKKTLLYLLSLQISLVVLAEKKTENSLIQLEDTTLHNRFIMSLFQEYELEGRWLFCRLDSVDVFREDWYDVIQTKTIYDAHTKNFNNVTKGSFISSVYPDFIFHNCFATYPNIGHPLSGVRVNLKLYKTLNELPLNKLIATYFNDDKTLKKKYSKLLYELIAACYMKNVKVITPSKGDPYYEIFK